jgi:hypothetical protein
MPSGRRDGLAPHVLADILQPHDPALFGGRRTEKCVPRRQKWMGRDRTLYGFDACEVNDTVAMMVTFADRIFLQLVKEIPSVRSF